MTQDATGLSFRADSTAPDLTTLDLMQSYRGARRQPALVDASGDHPPRRYDELIAPDGTVRPAWSGLAEEIVAQGAAALCRLAGRVARLVDDDGITYNAVGKPTNDAPGAPVASRLDPVPVLVGAADWDVLEAGLEQRASLLDAVLEDLYGPMETVRRGVVPPELVFGHPGIYGPHTGSRRRNGSSCSCTAATSAAGATASSGSATTGPRRRLGPATRWPGAG